jgi:hypothetical protein
MISGVFVLDARGECIISRIFRDDIEVNKRKSSIWFLFRYVTVYVCCTPHTLFCCSSLGGLVLTLFIANDNKF